MAIKYVPYFPNTIEGQAILDNFVRTRRMLKYRDNDKIIERLKRGMPLYEIDKIERVGENKGGNMVIRGECISTCAYLKEQGIEVDLVYIDPPFASGADYAKKIFIRRNPQVAEAIAKAEEEAAASSTGEEIELEDFKAFEEKMYGDVWDKEKYLNWMYENLTAIKSVMSDEASIYIHLDWNIGHYVKILMDEIFGEENFQNEIIWNYIKGASSKTSFGRKHQTIYYYSKSEKCYFDLDSVRIEYNPETIARAKRGEARYQNVNPDELEEKGKNPGDVWTDIYPVQGNSIQNTDYATQKPKALLERIIKASSKKNMVIADFFGGSGVTATVSNELGRRFIHCDVGINSVQTTRDRLIADKAQFDIYEIRDGVSLYRNPVQTMDKLKSLIIGLRNEDSLDKFWEGAITDSKNGLVPVYVPNLMDSSTKLLDTVLMNRIIHEAFGELPDTVRKVIVYYIDITDTNEIIKFIEEYNDTEISIELRDLKIILDDVVVEDYAEFRLDEVQKNLTKEYKITITKFISDRLNAKISEYNERGSANSLVRTTDEIDSIYVDKEKPKNKKKFKPIVISENGLELIEYISIDCSNKEKEDTWHSDIEIKIDKLGFVIKNGLKLKEFWHGTIKVGKKPMRIKIRNICGDESIFIVN